MRIFRWAGVGAVESRCVVVGITTFDEDLQISTFETLIGSLAVTTATLLMARNAILRISLDEVIQRAFLLALFSALVLGAFFANGLVITVTRAFFTACVTLATDLLADQWF